ncbi:MAG: hypothetical protein R2684_12905 [Pyrinomonadaceae bacterium]
MIFGRETKRIRIRIAIQVIACLFTLVSLAFPIPCPPPLPTPLSNNAVASLKIDGKLRVFSFFGLKRGKTHKDISRNAYMWIESGMNWAHLKDVPVDEGRLASTAEAAGGKIYIFGGYTVAEDGTEVSTPDVFSFDPLDGKYKKLKDIPTPVDDAVSFVYRNRYVYLVSGWSADKNVSLVQVFDTRKNRWFRATDYPGTPVFGHAGGIVENKFVIADGVAVVDVVGGKKKFDTVNEGWLGTIDKKDPAKIVYRRLPQLPGRGHYRMAGAGDKRRNVILFMGGTPTAYNYNGLGYNGTPASATKHVFGFDLNLDKWKAYDDKPVASMDHRGMFYYGGEWWSVGGMDSERNVIPSVLSERTSCRQNVPSNRLSFAFNFGFVNESQVSTLRSGL